VANVKPLGDVGDSDNTGEEAKAKNKIANS
jgi:hypothetical protein